MNQEERLDYLIKKLCEDSDQYQSFHIKQEDKPRLLRSLMNIRLPKPMSEEFLCIQDEYLQQELKYKGIVSLEEVPSLKKAYGSRDMLLEKISLWQGDITRLKADAIVNAANSQMLGCFVPCHSCIDNAIHSAAGIQLREECAGIMKKQGKHLKAGEAKITKAYNLPCTYVIHTAGPIVGTRLTKQDCDLLKSCYEACLTLAEENNICSIAFCCISTGEFHFPNERAAEIAVETVKERLKNSRLKQVIFNVFKDCDLEIYESLLVH